MYSVLELIEVFSLDGHGFESSCLLPDIQMWRSWNRPKKHTDPMQWTPNPSIRGLFSGNEAKVQVNGLLMFANKQTKRFQWTPWVGRFGKWGSSIVATQKLESCISAKQISVIVISLSGLDYILEQWPKLLSSKFIFWKPNSILEIYSQNLLRNFRIVQLGLQNHFVTFLASLKFLCWLGQKLPILRWTATY